MWTRWRSCAACPSRPTKGSTTFCMTAWPSASGRGGGEAPGGGPEKPCPPPVNTFDPSPPGCLDYVFVAGARVLDAALAFDAPHPSDASLFPSDHLGVMAKLNVG